MIQKTRYGSWASRRLFFCVGIIHVDLVAIGAFVVADPQFLHLGEAERLSPL